MEQKLITVDSSNFNNEKINHLLKTIKIKQISCGYLHFVLLDDQNNIYTCGNNSEGQLGLNHLNDVDYFVKISGFNKNVKFIATGGYFTIIVTLQNEIYGAGYTFILDKRQQFTNITKFSNDFIIKNIKCGAVNTIILNDKNELFGAGLNNCGQLGFEDFRKFTKFEKINLPNEIKEIKDYASGYGYSIILTKDNFIYIAGNNKFKTFTKINLQNYKQFGCLYDKLYLLSTENKLYFCEFTNYNLIEINFDKEIKKIYYGLGYKLYLFTKENELYYLKPKLNNEQEIGKVNNDWNLPYLSIYPANKFDVILNSNYCLDGIESNEIKRMIDLLFKQIKVAIDNPFVDITIYLQ